VITMEFEEVAGWGGELWAHDVTGVAVDAQDRVYALKRDKHAVTVLSPQGEVLTKWGHPCISDRPHLISIGFDELVYIADDGGHQIHVFDLEGQWLETLGSGVPSSTGFDASIGGVEQAYDLTVGGPPFHRPTKAVVSPSGELFVSDGYRNSRIHRFSEQRDAVYSWGGPGAGPGCFVIPHSVQVDASGNVFVCDRENDRIQVFSRSGEFLSSWENVQRPTDIAFDPSGRAYVTELPRGPRDIKSWRLGRAEEEMAGAVSVRSTDGSALAWLPVSEAGFPAPHAVAVDSENAVYVSEVPESFASYTGRALKEHRCLRKFVRVR